MTLASSKGFAPPPYPYSRLARLAEVANGHEGGLVDLSVGTPCDPPPDSVVEALSTSGSERGYPSSIGAPQMREAAAAWIERRFGVPVDPAHIAASVGTKEFVATSAWYMRLRRPDRDVVIAPRIAYPTYAMGARLAGCRLIAVGHDRTGAEDLAGLERDVVDSALMLWVNSPSNPTGALSDLSAAAAWGREHGVPVFSDECYAEFTWDRNRPSTILSGGPAGLEGVLAVHSLSKRSNMAGLRAGFYAGDPELVGYLGILRQHCGLMIPGPVQTAAVAALRDDTHVSVQRDRYWRRLELLARAFGALGLETRMPQGGFYLWVRAPQWTTARTDAGLPSPGWVLAEALAASGGLLVSPGDLYGEEGGAFVRVAAVQPDDRIELAAKRLGANGDLEMAFGTCRDAKSLQGRA